MNPAHDTYCSSPEWAAILAEEVLPWGLSGVDLGDHTVELGGGFGASTTILIGRTGRLTVIEADQTLAAGLADRFPTADVRHADATAIPIPDGAVSSVLCFTMLHHVTPPSAQDAIFAEAHRVLRPGGWFAGTDSLASPDLRDFHDGDVYEPVDPTTLPGRLHTAGFTEVEVDAVERRLRFRARRPAAPGSLSA
jgi:ubiquinone/menaquinone biosynthesis C-methylase UbiE